MHRDHTDQYSRDQLNCSGYDGGECDISCGYFPADIPLCESGLCELYSPNWRDSHDWTWIPIDSDYQMSFPIAFEGPGFVEDGEETSFLLRRRDGKEKWHFETGLDSPEPAELESLPSTFQYSRRYDLALGDNLKGSIYYDRGSAWEAEELRRAILLLGPIDGPFREIIHIEYDGTFVTTAIAETITLR